MAQEEIHLTCGTRLFIEDAPASGVYIEIQDITTFGDAIGQVGTFIESTTVADCDKTYTSGLSDAPDLPISFFWSPTANQLNFRAAAVAKETRQARVIFSDTGTGGVATADFQIALAGFTLGDPSPDTILTANVSGKGSKFTWS